LVGGEGVESHPRSKGVERRGYQGGAMSQEQFDSLQPGDLIQQNNLIYEVVARDGISWQVKATNPISLAIIPEFWTIVSKREDGTE
jgi:hypothetical protein